MGNKHTLDCQYETIVWGTLFIWWGLRGWLLVSLPDGSGMLGTGLILLGLVAVRSLQGMVTPGFTTFLGILALLWGGLEIANSTLGLPFKLPVFEILLILSGLALLARELLRFRQVSLGN